MILLTRMWPGSCQYTSHREVTITGVCWPLPATDRFGGASLVGCLTQKPRTRSYRVAHANPVRDGGGKSGDCGEKYKAFASSDERNRTVAKPACRSLASTFAGDR